MFHIYFILFTFIFDRTAQACRILVPWPGIESVFPAVEAWSPNYWTTKKFPTKFILEVKLHESFES